MTVETYRKWLMNEKEHGREVELPKQQSRMAVYEEVFNDNPTPKKKEKKDE